MQMQPARRRFAQPYITDGRIEFAVQRAADIAARNHDWSAFDCADAAVRQVFGRWLLDHAANLPPARMPLFLRLVDEVESRLGLHRRRRGRPAPMDPALADIAAEWQLSDLRSIA